MNIKGILTCLRTHKMIFLIAVLILLVIIPGVIYLLLWIPIPTNNSDDNGWLSFWGSFLGGIFGGTGTLMAVIITTKQAQKHQIENLKKTNEIQKENLQQIKIKNINEKINDLRNKLVVLNKSSDIICKNNLIFRTKIDMNSLNYSNMLEYSKNITEFHSALLSQSGDVGIEDMQSQDAAIMNLSNQLAARTQILIKYFNENYRIVNEIDYENIEKIINESREIYIILNKKILNLCILIKNEITSQIDKKYKCM